MGIAEPPCHRVPLLWRTAFPGWIPEQTLLCGTLPNESLALEPSAGALDVPTACQHNGRRVRTAPHGTTTQLGLGLGALVRCSGMQRTLREHIRLVGGRREKHDWLARGVFPQTCAGDLAP